MVPPAPRLRENHPIEVEAVPWNRYHVWRRSPQKVLEVQEAASIGRYLRNQSALSVLRRLKAKKTRRLFEPYEHEEAAEEPQPAPARAPQPAEPAGSEALEPRRIALPLPGQEISRASPTLQRILEKMRNEVELRKLHMKHYHMSPAQFRRKTSMLGLPGEIYGKYDRVVKSCKVCSTSVPSPPRARIAGPRASSFGDFILVDHAEIKYATSLYLVLLIIDGATNLLWATALTTLEVPETLGVFRLWIEENNCMPKGIVGDQVFCRICS